MSKVHKDANDYTRANIKELRETLINTPIAVMLPTTGRLVEYQGRHLVSLTGNVLLDLNAEPGTDALVWADDNSGAVGLPLVEDSVSTFAEAAARIRDKFIESGCQPDICIQPIQWMAVFRDDAFDGFPEDAKLSDVLEAYIQPVFDNVNPLAALLAGFGR